MTKILLVDDDDALRRIAALCLRRLGGLDVSEASSGAAAIELARRDRPDLILLDVMMPDLDGPHTLLALRAAPATADIPVVFLTAKVQRTDVEHLIGLGVLGVIAKPFEPVALAADVRRFLELR